MPFANLFEAGLYMMTLPIAVTVGMMVAPVAWMFGSRPKR
jgi:hypothetical protein